MSVLPQFIYIVLVGLIATGFIVIGQALITRRVGKRDCLKAVAPTNSPAVSTDTNSQEDLIGELEAHSIIRRPLLTASETAFFRALQEAVGTDYVIFTQIPLWTMLDTASADPKLSRSFRNRISLKRVDFALMNAATMEPYMVVELDDRSHKREDRMKRDAFVAAVLDRAGIPLLRIPVAPTYFPPKLKQLLGINNVQKRTA